MINRSSQLILDSGYERYDAIIFFNSENDSASIIPHAYHIHDSFSILGWNKNSNFHEHVSWKVIPTCRKYKMRGEIPAKIRDKYIWNFRQVQIHYCDVW